jgi:hypothetical protein
MNFIQQKCSSIVSGVQIKLKNVKAMERGFPIVIGYGSMCQKTRDWIWGARFPMPPPPKDLALGALFPMATHPPHPIVY